MRVLVITKTKNGGGTEKHISEVSSALIQRGWDINVAYTEDGFWALYRHIYRGCFDIVHFFLPRPYVLGSIACELAFHHNRIMSRRSLTNSYQKPWIRLIEQLLHKRTRILVGNSPTVVEQLAAEAKGKDIRLIRNGVKIIPAPEYKSTVFTMVTVANAFRYKGHEDLIAAIVYAAPRLPEPWRLMLIGRGTEQYRYWRVEGLGFLETDAVREWLAKADLFILPSHEEGSSNALLEAMASGVPVIATNIGGNRDAIIHDENGILVPPYDSRTLARAILWAANHREICKAMALRAKEDVKKRFSFERCVGEYEALYHSAA